MVELIKSAVLFDEETHTYTLGDKQLSGITSIIKSLIFPNMYASVSQAVLNRAAERGTRIHNLVQLWALGILSDEDIAELQPFLDALSNAGLLQYDSEYLVSDNELVASSIDLVCMDDDNNFILCDIKTTSVLHIEYLQWQLSIYAYLFERQNPTLKVHSLKAIHIRDGKCAIVDITRLSDEHIEALLNAYRNGDETFDNPLHALPEGIDELLKQYAENEACLSDIDQVKKVHDERKKALQAAIGDALRSQNMQKMETDMAKVTIGKDSVTPKFDFKSFVQSDIYKQSPDLYKDFIKETTTAGRITITLR